MKLLRLLPVVLLLCQMLVAQSWEDTLAHIEAIASQYRSNTPGCQVAVSRNGQLLFSKAWGMADLERNVPLSVNSLLEAGSVSKQFTAAAILLLEQQGKLTLNDDVRKYIPELPNYGSVIRLQHLLHHTSGLRDWGSVAELTGWPRGKKVYSNQDALEIIVRQQHLNNQPGAEYIYSNSNYTLLTIIAERVSGQSLAAFTKQNIFEPAGMVHTQWRDDPNRVVPNRAIAYSNTGSAFEINMPNEYVYGHGGLLTTTEDLLQWCNFYQQGHLGSASLLARQTQILPLNNGVTNNYAAGLVLQQQMGWNNISHSGATAGYRAYLETFPELQLSFAILSNTTQYNITEIAARLHKLFVTAKTVQTSQKDTAVALSAAGLNRFAGMYRNERDGSTFTLTVQGNQILLDEQVVMIPVSKNLLKAANFQLLVNNGKGFYLPNTPPDSIPFTRMIAGPLPSKQLGIYEGHYAAAETNSVITIRRQKDSLEAQVKAGQWQALQPRYKDGYRIAALDADLQFTRAANNSINGFTVSINRARNIVFKKTP